MPDIKRTLPEKKQRLFTQLTNKDEKISEKEEHQLIYRAFLDILENPEKQTQQEIEKKKQKLKEELSNQELQSNLKSLDKRLERLQNGNEKKIFTFISKNHEGIFNNINQEDIKLLSEENFCQLLLSVFEKIRKENLANEENLKNGKIEKAVAECVADIRGTEAKDSLIKLLGWPLGVKVDPKNFFGSFKDGLLEKVPFFGKDKKEEDEPPLSDEEMVTTFLRKIFLPILFSIASISIFGPTTLAVVAAAIGAIFAIKGGVGVLFSNDKKGTLYNPHSQDEKKKEGWDGKILDGINTILKTPVEKAKGSEQVTSVGKEKSEQQPVPEKASQKNEKSEQQPKPVFEQVTLDQQAKNKGQQPSNT
ncbi:hypothetical protein JTE90_028686 [Oedothorax gibbosus]|uniref:Uncharacterized protein n=1 Tax=Oedothorax gibbosus TaxID=931172 RepID=A0AAV6TEB3_9ARAC|nr:hypothetical protein [Wolbachia endosymbiont of Oedothorax gibbosus]KAG8156016.1 hypothetical protein JTE90_028686 [Oedothorax gibbosus]